MNLLPVEVLENVDFVENVICRAQVPHRGMGRVLVGRPDPDLGVMSQELAAQHLDDGGESVKRVRARVHADECMAGLERPDEARLVWNRQIPRRIGKNQSIHSVQPGLGEFFGNLGVVLALGSTSNHVDDGVSPAGFTHCSEDILSRGNRTVPEPFGGGDQNQFLGSGLDCEQAGDGQQGDNAWEFHGQWFEKQDFEQARTGSAAGVAGNNPMGPKSPLDGKPGITFAWPASCEAPSKSEQPSVCSEKQNEKKYCPL